MVGSGSGVVVIKLYLLGFFFFFFNFGFWFWWDLGGQRWRGGHGGGVVIVTRLFGFFLWVCWVFGGYLLSFFLFFY